MFEHLHPTHWRYAALLLSALAISCGGASSTASDASASSDATDESVVIVGSPDSGDLGNDGAGDGSLAEAGLVPDGEASADGGAGADVALPEAGSVPDATAPHEGGLVEAGSGCVIGGISYASGAMNPSNKCQSCQPTASTSAWTTAATGTTCDAQSFCNAAGTCESGCFIGGAVYAAGVVNASNKCQSCQPTASTSAWTTAATGTTCDTQSICNAAGTCEPGCFIAGTVYGASALNPSNPCQSCAPASSTSDWTDLPSGTACGTGTCSAATCWSSLSDASNWNVFDLTTVNAAAVGFRHANFDGRYLYLIPSSEGSGTYSVVARYDTGASFSSASSWSVFDTSSLNAAAKGFQGSAFDGRYLYFVPCVGSSGGSGLVVRYDTTATFTGASSWATFDTISIASSAKGFAGASFDGRYLYLVPDYNGAYDGVAVRYDTTSNFSFASSWATFDITTVNANAKGFNGSAFDGRYLYLVPDSNASNVYDGLVARYDTTANFSSASSWSTFDTTTVNATAKGFVGGAFDGRYIYLAPWTNGSAYDGLVTRYDTSASFGAAASWSTFDTSTVNANAVGFTDATFDGRYLYLPAFETTGGGVDGIVARYDTSAPFSATSSWSAFDATTVNAGASDFWGAAFDGQSAYFVSLFDNFKAPDGIVVQFKAKSPRSMPALCASPQALHCFSGSFF